MIDDSVMRRAMRLALLCGALTAMPAMARDYCPDRPGIDTPPCTIDPGHLSVEMSLGDWTHQSDSDAVTDTWLAGDLALRYGVAEHAELRLGWTPFGHVRTRDRATGAITTASGAGDVVLGIKRNLVDPEGKQLSVALLPSISLPVGGSAIGAGDWGAGMQLPFSLPAGKTFTLLLTPEIDAAVNGSRSGRHVAYGSAGGVAFAPVENLNVAIEASALRDEDPAGAHTNAIAGASAALTLHHNLQLDIGAEFGLNAASPASHLYVGIAKRF